MLNCIFFFYLSWTLCIFLSFFYLLFYFGICVADLNLCDFECMITFVFTCFLSLIIQPFFLYISLWYHDLMLTCFFIIYIYIYIYIFFLPFSIYIYVYYFLLLHVFVNRYWHICGLLLFFFIQFFTYLIYVIMDRFLHVCYVFFFFFF